MQKVVVLRAGIVLTLWCALLASTALMEACDGSEGSDDDPAARKARHCTGTVEWNGRTYLRRPMQRNAVAPSGRLSDGVFRNCPANDSRRQPAQLLKIKSVRPTIAIVVNGKPGIFVRPGYGCKGGSRYSSWRPLVCHRKG
jgi:hypothetical protein